MKGYDVLAGILKMQGVEFISAFPNQPLIESCAKIICFIEKNYEFFNTVDMETFVSLYHEDVVVKVNGMHKTTSIVEAKLFGK